MFQKENGRTLELKKFSTFPKIYLTHLREIPPNIFEDSVIHSRVDVNLVLSQKPQVLILIFLSLLVLVFDGTLNVNFSC